MAGKVHSNNTWDSLTSPTSILRGVHSPAVHQLRLDPTYQSQHTAALDGQNKSQSSNSLTSDPVQHKINDNQFLFDSWSTKKIPVLSIINSYLSDL